MSIRLLSRGGVVVVARRTPTAARALLAAGLLATTAGCASSVGSYVGYGSYDELDDAADIVVKAEVLDDRRDLAEGLTSPSRIAEMRVTATSKGEAIVGDEFQLHYDQPQNSDFRLLESQAYIVFASFYPEDGEAYALSDAQGVYGRDGAHVMGFDDDEVVLPPEVLVTLA